MIICGNIYVAKDVSTFSLKCLYCEKDVNEWQDFVYHIQSFHNPDDEKLMKMGENPQLSILVEDIKVEGDFDLAHNKEEDENTFPTDDHIMTADSNDIDDSDSEDCSSKESEPESLTKSTKLKPSFHKRSDSTKEFIELYKNFPCLWDPNDINYKNFPERGNACNQIITALKKKCNIIISERDLKAAIRQLRKQYYETLQMIKTSSTKITTIMHEHFELCSFLTVFEEHPEDITNESDMKYLSFGKLNDITLGFIDSYASFPVLYDPNNIDYTNIAIRKQAYEDMAKAFKTKDNVVITEEEIVKCIYSLRHWYYKALERHKKKVGTLPLTDVQEIYMEKCSFLPAKIVKKRLACDVCGNISHSEMTLQVHMFKKHQVGELPYKCGECNRSFEHKSALQVHHQRCHQDKVHKCEHCWRRFAILVDLQRHVRTHTGEKPFVCELCGKAFAVRTQLGYHTAAIHTKIRAYKCTMCPKDFLKKRDLTDHIKAHLNIRDKICETCGKGFTNCHSLIRHRQIHSEVKKFACKLCDAKFHQFVGLNAHLKRTHNIIKGKPNV